MMKTPCRMTRARHAVPLLMLLLWTMALAPCAQASGVMLELDPIAFFLTGDEYTFAGCPWLSSPEEVEAILDMDLGDPGITMPTDEMPFQQTIYMPQTRIAYPFGEGTAVFEFRDEQLTSVQCTLRHMDVEAVYAELIDAFTASAGEADKVIEVDEDITIGDRTAHVVISGRQWHGATRGDGRYTALEIRKSGSGDEQSLTIGYALFDEAPQ